MMRAPAQDDLLAIGAEPSPLDGDGALVADVEPRVDAILVGVEDEGDAVPRCRDEEVERRRGRHGEVEGRGRGGRVGLGGGARGGELQGPGAEDLERLEVAQDDAVPVDRRESTRVGEDDR